MKNYIFTFNVGVCGRVTTNSVVKKNTITNEGLLHICYALLDKAMPLKWVGVGDDDSNGTPDEIALQTELKNERGRNIAFKREVLSGETQNEAKFRVQAIFNRDDMDGVGLIESKERGLFDRWANYLEPDNVAGGLMFARIVGDDANITFDVERSFDWDIIFQCSENTIDSGGIVYDANYLLAESLYREDVTAFDGEHYEWGLNTVAVGTSAVSTEGADKDLHERLIAHDSQPTITNVDVSNPEEPILTIQKYIPLNSISADLHEAGVFNSHKRKPDSMGDLETVKQRMFSRVIIEPYIPANTEATLTFKIKIKRSD